MIAVENVELYRYEIHSLLKAFYPQETVKVFVGEPDERKYPEPAFLRVDFENDRIEMTILPPEQPAVTRTAQAPEGIAYDRKSTECKTAAKHLLYEMLCAHTGTTLPWGELIGIRPTKIAMTRLREGDSVEEAALFMEREHLVSPEKAALAADIADRERRILSGIHYEDGYSLYVGIPFCPTTCLYCSFPSFNLALWKDRVDSYLDALEREMKACSEMMKGRVLDTVYIGGGTPTTLEPAQLERLFAMLEKYFPMENVQEFTIEAGRPDSITMDKLRVIRAHDVTRISVNPQTMKEETLRLIGRMHTVDEVRQAYAMCREAGFDNINMDMILGLPEETLEDVRDTLRQITDLSPDSLTVHSLALKRGSRMQKYIEEKGFSSIYNTDGCMELAAEAAAGMGMEPYYLYRQKNISGNLENVGYARPGKAGIYNILIMEEKQSILALGAGSISKAVFDHGRIERSDNCKDVATYIENVEEMIGRKARLGIGDSQ